MCHLKSRNGCHRHKEINILAGIEFQPGIQHFFPFFLFLVTAANTSWQKMCHLGSPANKRVVKGIFVIRDRPLFFPVKCEMAIFFLVNRDFYSSREP